MRLLIYGGTFNPPHLGHADALSCAAAALGADRVLVIPAGIPPHKALAEGSPSAEERLRLCNLAFPEADVTPMELHREGKSYTVDTVRELRRRYPESELWLARKRNAVELTEGSSLRMFAEMEAAGQTFADRKLCGDDYAAGGGFPIALRGTGVIGSICVSGFDDHLDDHQLVINTLAEYLA